MSVISPATWRQYVYPHMKTVCDTLHSYGNDARIYCHICGNVLPIVDDLLNAGLDCIAPLDPLGGFSVLDIRNRVGDDVILMGGVNTLSFTDATCDEIRAEARICIDHGYRQGRYILGSGCVIPPTAKRENIEALVQEAEVVRNINSNEESF
jgi:uroporphyrinogen-III decarboxylase